MRPAARRHSSRQSGSPTSAKPTRRPEPLSSAAPAAAKVVQAIEAYTPLEGYDPDGRADPAGPDAGDSSAGRTPASQAEDMMLRKHLLTSAVAMAVASTLAPSVMAQEAECLGLDCPGVTPANSKSRGIVESVENPRSLESAKPSGFYDYGSRGTPKKRAIAYVVKPGEWDSVPREIKDLRAADFLSASERANNTTVFYGSGTITTVPPVKSSAASTKKSRKARAAGWSACSYSGSFCLFDDFNGNGARGQWFDTGYWQNLSAFGWQGRARSMWNRRNGWTLLERVSGGRYCAVPNSQDGSLANNGYDRNTTRVYLSTATIKQSAWGCTN